MCTCTSYPNCRWKEKAHYHISTSQSSCNALGIVIAVVHVPQIYIVPRRNNMVKNQKENLGQQKEVMQLFRRPTLVIQILACLSLLTNVGHFTVKLSER